MKNLICILALFMCFSRPTSAQITLEYTSPIGQTIATAVPFSAASTKWMIIDTGINVIKLYSSDFSIWKNIPISVPAGMKFINVSYVSDKLFNTDDQVEAIVTFQSIGTPYSAQSIIMGETGATLFDLGQYTYSNVVYLNGSHKLITYNSSIRFNKIYALPGELPCGHCGVMGVPKSSSAANQASSPTAYPNPASGDITVRHGLPVTASGVITINGADGRSFGTWPVSGIQPELNININALSPGFYTFTVMADGVQTIYGSFVK